MSALPQSILILMEYWIIKMKRESGQSLIELLIAMGLFALWISSITFLFLNARLSDRLAIERAAAVFLAREGMEAVRSVRDSSWEEVTTGEHGLSVIGNNWTLQGSQEETGDVLPGGTRKIIVEEINADRKKITSQVNWELTDGRPQEIRLVTYLTNWKKVVSGPQTCFEYCQSLDYSGGACRSSSFWCFIYGETHESEGDQFCPGSWEQDTCCCD
ncbi:MAG: hypothetical protein GF370_04430 [Candidatus Nealsonbacteria bacterium]|nr:hypothetical protein [Candidatus Nealsonbacteria bacterium]